MSKQMEDLAKCVDAAWHRWAGPDYWDIYEKVKKIMSKQAKGMEDMQKKYHEYTTSSHRLMKDDKRHAPAPKPTGGKKK